MYLDIFVRTLPILFHGWNTPDIRPVEELPQLPPGMSSPCNIALLRHAVRHMEPGEIFCEVGSHQGKTLIGAVSGTGRKAIAIDNFSEFNTTVDARSALYSNVNAIAEEVAILELDCETALQKPELQRQQIGVFYYDGAHDYDSTRRSLDLVARHGLSHNALIVVDDTNWSEPRRATEDFLGAHDKAELLFDLKSPGNAHHTWWNGVMVLGWRSNCTSRP